MDPQLPTYRKLYHKKFPQASQAKLIGYVGLENLKFLRNISNRKEKFDLNLLIEETICKPADLDPKLTELLKFLSLNSSKFSLTGDSNVTLNKARFFCYRGLMSIIASTPYENNEGWKIAVMLFNGNIYMCMRKTDKKIHDEQNQTEEQKQFTSWGHKFEQFLLSDRPNSDPDPNTPNNEFAEFSCFYERNINQHTVIYGAEMDGVLVDNAGVTDPPGKDADPQTVLEYLKPLKFVELKTHAHFHIGSSENSFRMYKARKTWCQCWLTDVQTLVVGFRNKAGIVEELKSYSLDDLAKMRKNWDPVVCISFLDAFLSYVKDCLAYVIQSEYGVSANDNIQDLPLTTMLLEWEPKRNVTMSKNWDNDIDVVLPKWYLDSIRDYNRNRSHREVIERRTFKQSTMGGSSSGHTRTYQGYKEHERRSRTRRQGNNRNQGNYRHQGNYSQQGNNRHQGNYSQQGNNRHQGSYRYKGWPYEAR